MTIRTLQPHPWWIGVALATLFGIHLTALGLVWATDFEPARTPVRHVQTVMTDIGHWLSTASRDTSEPVRDHLKQHRH